MASITTSAGVTYIADKSIMASQKALAQARLFMTNFSDQVVESGTTMKIKVYDTSDATEFDRDDNNYADTNGSIIYVEVTFGNHAKKTFSFTSKDFLEINKTAFGDAGKAAGIGISGAILKAISGKLTKANLPASPESILSSITKTTIASLRAACARYDIDPERTVVLLNPDAYAEVLALPNFAIWRDAANRGGIIENPFGFKAIAENTRLSQVAGEKLVGALVPEDNLVVAGRVVPVANPDSYSEVGVVKDSASGLALGVRKLGEGAKDDVFLTTEVLFGNGVPEPTKIVRLVSAATA